MSFVTRKPFFGVSDQVRHKPASQPQKLARAFKFPIKKLEIINYLGSEQNRCWSHWEDAQADLRLCCLHRAKVGFLMTKLIYMHRDRVLLLYWLIFFACMPLGQLKPVRQKYVVVFFYLWFLWPIKIISLILSQVNHQAGRIWEIPKKNHLTTWLVSQDPSNPQRRDDKQFRALNISDSATVAAAEVCRHYARRYMSNGMVHIQRSFREFVCAFNKFWLVESWFFDTWSSGSRYITQWKAVVRWPSAVQCICCHWTMYPKINFQPIRICLTHVQIRGMNVGHVSFLWT